MVIREHGIPRPDNTEGLVGNIGQLIDQSNAGRQHTDTNAMRTRATLGESETRLSFGILMDSRHEESYLPHVKPPLQDGEVRSLTVLETGQTMPYQPPEGKNLISTRIYKSVDAPLRLDLLVNDALADVVYVDGGGSEDHQLAELFELVEAVDELNGQNTIEFQVTPLTETEVLGTVFLRFIERDLEV